MTRQLHLNAFLMTQGHHDAAWRHPLSRPDRATDITYFEELAQTAERGTFDSIFFADGLAVWNHLTTNVSGVLEPLLVLAAVARATSRIGLIATVSTTFNEPFHLARKFASLDHISGGRAGWNIVTSGSVAEANNFNRDEHLDHRIRYERAAEFLEVVTALWDSWADDAVLLDVERGVYADGAKVREINHAGEHFQVRGPLNVQRSPQGWPVLVQAGSSEDGKEFAARYSEAIFTAQQTIADAQTFYKDVKTRAERLGRDPEGIKILPGICPIIGATETEALRLEAELTELQVIEYGLHQLSSMLNTDVSGLPLDAPIPDDLLPAEAAVNGNKSRFALVSALAGDGLTVRQIIARLGGGRGHRVFAGAPEQIADQLEEWFRNGAADGFNVMPPILPTGLTDFVDHVVPILRARGLFREEYTGRTLRDHYGLPRPAGHRFEQPIV